MTDSQDLRIFKSSLAFVQRSMKIAVLLTCEMGWARSMPELWSSVSKFNFFSYRQLRDVRSDGQARDATDLA
jgi:hypothetical protein